MSSTAPSPMSPQRRRQILIIVAVVAVVLVVALIAVVSRLGRDSDTGTPAPTGAATSVGAPSATTSASPTATGTPSASAPSSSASKPVQSPAPTPKASLPSPTATGKPTVVPTAKTSKTTVPLDQREPTETGVTAKVTKISPVDGTAEGPGEIAGPALRITVTVRNRSDAAVSLEQGLVNLYYGSDETPASLLSGPGAVPFPRSVKAGTSGSGTFVFGVPKGERDTIAVEFSYSTDSPTVVFKGAA